MGAVVGLILALTALAVGVMNGVDPVDCMIRAALAFAVGWFGVKMWNSLYVLVSQPAEAEVIVVPTVAHSASSPGEKTATDPPDEIVAAEKAA